jgi:hypothetical protein
MSSFNPNTNTLQEGIALVQKTMADAGIPQDKIITSRHPAVQKTLPSLKVGNVPNGFSKWQLPVYFDGPSLLYMSFGAPHAHVPEHSHDEGNGIRVILSGSINYGGHELTGGDWMYLPKGTKYSFDVGPMGVGMFYCYQCCCR